jgi:hypothetical protein
MKTIAIISLLLTSCTVESITVRGKFGDYIFKPRKPITVETSK